MGRTSASRFEIWQVGSRVHSIDNDVRIGILAALEEKPHTLNGLMERTRKAKSTLSAVHLAPLLDAGLVEEAVDPDDARVKWYRLVGHRLGASSVDRSNLRDAVLQYVQSSGLIPLGPLLEVLDVPDLLSSGSINAYAQGVAKRLGALVGRMLTAAEPKDAAKELARILEAAKLAPVEIVGPEVRVPAKATPQERFVKTLATEALRAWRGR